MKIKVTVNSEEFEKQFQRYCNEFDSLFMAVAWCGKPSIIDDFPYNQLTKLPRKTNAIIGISFSQSNPKGILKLREISNGLKIFDKKDSIFHPKFFLFENKKTFAAIIGSTNFTFNAFRNNIEAVTIIEGNKSDNYSYYKKLKQIFFSWYNSDFSFKFNNDWFEEYKTKYEKVQKFFGRQKKIKSPIIEDNKEEILTNLQKLEWAKFYKRVTQVLNNNDIPLFDKKNNWFKVLEERNQFLRLPLTIKLFDDKLTRKFLWGDYSSYNEDEHFGAFGNVGANGKFKGLITNGSLKNKRTILRVMNTIFKLKVPINYYKVEKVLQQLCNIQHRKNKYTMFCWGRLLLLSRPDLFFTVARSQVRTNISRELTSELNPSKGLDTPSGYINALKKIHKSKWFLSNEPKENNENFYWKNRVALLDILFYSLD